jgi:acetylornithine deacetylase/succinyl-diaminopimelate desuccinylase-like protein
MPNGAHYEISGSESGSGYIADLSSEIAKKVSSAFEKTWGNKVVEAGIGGSVPFAKEYKDAFPSSSVLLTAAAPFDCNMHGNNESLNIPDFFKGVLGEALALYNIGE